MSNSESDARDRISLRDRIEIRAYELYVERGCEGGHAVEDWLAAEAELAAPAREPLRQETRRATATR